MYSHFIIFCYIIIITTNINPTMALCKRNNRMKWLKFRHTIPGTVFFAHLVLGVGRAIRFSLMGPKSGNPGPAVSKNPELSAVSKNRGVRGPSSAKSGSSSRQQKSGSSSCQQNPASPDVSKNQGVRGPPSAKSGSSSRQQKSGIGDRRQTRDIL